MPEEVLPKESGESDNPKTDATFFAPFHSALQAIRYAFPSNEELQRMSPDEQQRYRDRHVLFSLTEQYFQLLRQAQLDGRFPSIPDLQTPFQPTTKKTSPPPPLLLPAVPYQPGDGWRYSDRPPSPTVPDPPWNGGIEYSPRSERRLTDMDMARLGLSEDFRFSLTSPIALDEMSSLEEYANAMEFFSSPEEPMSHTRPGSRSRNRTGDDSWRSPTLEATTPSRPFREEGGSRWVLESPRTFLESRRTTASGPFGIMRGGTYDIDSGDDTVEEEEDEEEEEEEESGRSRLSNMIRRIGRVGDGYGLRNDSSSDDNGEGGLREEAEEGEGRTNRVYWNEGRIEPDYPPGYRAALFTEPVEQEIFQNHDDLEQGEWMGALRRIVQDGRRRIANIHLPGRDVDEEENDDLANSARSSGLSQSPGPSPLTSPSSPNLLSSPSEHWSSQEEEEPGRRSSLLEDLARDQEMIARVRAELTARRVDYPLDETMDEAMDEAMENRRGGGDGRERGMKFKYTGSTKDVLASPGNGGDPLTYDEP
ncbi:hypothetical protein BJ684DRAFT_15497 [Piptocephalis cylindrospora]|uniref:Uncharacterized protein n=1 Tax=Piptocephalis cylindrospora TaxID=1907219 RepID=A0A4P9Y5U1_9FUNG|nr:hypothetical protein BJ684DRAFT_15497 [Piptocephalis cylindrospora]|eukprot:RKP14164.1 hypothetical protein BJ684DRAFT_15497 [Piptocephalis cylindrospora]